MSRLGTEALDREEVEDRLVAVWRRVAEEDKQG